VAWRAADRVTGFHFAAAEDRALPFFDRRAFRRGAKRKGAFADDVLGLHVIVAAGCKQERAKCDER
jgi:hypothetical protein